MAYRKWKETNVQPGTAGPSNMLGCSLVSFHFLWAILCPQAVDADSVIQNLEYGLALTKISLFLKVANIPTEGNNHNENGWHKKIDNGWTKFSIQV